MLEAGGHHTKRRTDQRAAGILIPPPEIWRPDPVEKPNRQVPHIHIADAQERLVSWTGSPRVSGGR